MARRRRYYGATASSAAAPAAIKTKPLTLDVGALKSALDWMVLDKDLGFRLAFEWYAGNTPTLLATNCDASGRTVPLTPDQQKKFDRALLCKNQAEGTNYEQERLTFAAKALKLYEEVFPARNLPSVETALAATTPGPRVSSVQTVLGRLNSAYARFGVEFKLTLDEADRALADGKILLSLSEVESMVTQPPLKTVLGEALTVAKAVSVVRDDVGERFDGKLFMSNLPLALNAVNDWAMDLGGGVFKSTGKAPKAPSATIKKAGGTVRARVTGACRVKLTSPKIARLADMLKAGATTAQIMAAIPSWNADSVKWYINETAKALGLKAVRTGDVWSVR